MVELLFWPALVAYGEAALAYAGDARRPGGAGRLATWGVRLGWLLQTGLLVVQAARADGFPWGTWAGSLNLFVWLVVSVYLVWGCRSRFRLLGLAVMPLAAALLVLARVGGGTGDAGRSHYSTAFLVLHVGLVSFAFAAFTLSAGLSALYLWQERRLKGRRAGGLLGRAPSLVTLESIAGRTIAVALPALTIGIVAGLVRVSDQGTAFDALMVVTLVTWLVYAAYVVLRFEVGWRGRRVAYLALAGFALVIVARLGLQLSHFS
ncbi:MAG TPA: cytochrome c biogenesis protein CcsA [Gaiellaceae bacterium]|nr:cytochrome c biogenesis protein CcsA [Gaiellaceae bacterium]